MRVLALDYGRARCGCAVSDPTGTLATPLDAVTDVTSRRGRARLRELVKRAAAPSVWSSACRCRCRARTRRRPPRLASSPPGSERALPVPVELYDERFTTRLAERTPGRASEDSRAAAHLLESWLASRRTEEIAHG